MALEDVVILNVDTNTLETPFDDLQSLPNDVVRINCLDILSYCITRNSNPFYPFSFYHVSDDGAKAPMCSGK